MPKLPAVKSKDLIRVLKSVGFFEHRQRSTSHLVMKHNDGRRTIVSIHSGKDIPKGTLLAILKDIQITKEEFLKIL
ncbi:MAG: type II toxin-antitoxin system HicA family toxin [Patescibacteria group bacterium]